MDNDDSDDCLTDLGFMFDSYHSRDTKKISFEKFDISLHLIDEDPGHVQSGQHLWPGAFYLSSYCKCSIWFAFFVEIISFFRHCVSSAFTCFLFD